MTHDPRKLDDEARWTRLVRAVDDGAPPPDVARLNRLRQESLAAFLAAGDSADRSAAERATGDAPDSDVHHAAPKGTSMFSLVIRTVVALAASAGFVAWLGFLSTGSLADTVTFGEVLEHLRRVESLQLRLEREGREGADVWIKAPGLVRIDEAEGRYQVAAGSRLWRVDEEAETTVAGDSPWYVAPDRQIDLLRLLDVGVRDGSPLLAARAVRRERFEHRDCLVYEVRVPTNAPTGAAGKSTATSGGTSEVALEAFADVASRQFVALRAWPADGARRRDGRPLAELRLVARDVALDDEQFAVARNLTDDGRIGKIVETQGLVVLRPMTAKRWTPLGPGTLVAPGDWLRVDLRGANAVRVELASRVELVLGPGSLLECIDAGAARLHAGWAQVKLPEAPADAKFTLRGPRGGDREFARPGKTLVRVDRDERLVGVPQTPVWLEGFEGASTRESLGSLVASLPDGRNEPLSVGEHKVTVEIRDQIARTTIEETFVNHTAGRLEGTFQFPLPQDASISGFGMWIGDELIEADIVEKQRAREIYETILREKRDPGLLEWTSGNLFKARVFPIEPRSEKRIKLVYTQVLPLRANRYRYSYGLRSELLRTKPLRELSLTVTIDSALPLKEVACTSHAARVQQTGRAARVEFTAQEHVPTRDFEVACELDRAPSDVIVVPHRRGDDGYFLLQLTPPTPEGKWRRDVLPDGRPVHLVLLCDTSGSMDAEKRRQQSEFVAAMLAALGPDDRFELAACDVRAEWSAPQPSAPDAESIAAARKFLDDRPSLGWTDLDRAFADVARRAPGGAQVVYVGDGMIAARDADPNAFVGRLAKLLVGERPADKRDAAPSAENRTTRRTFHAVSVGDATEAIVLRGIASVGGGSTRAIAGEQTPRSVARELLDEVANPGLSDVQVEFRGVRVAAVYPERIPNLPAGTQQMLVGRYLPEGRDQRGEVVVTGRLGDRPVRYAASIVLADAEQGNSFIPRLWARGHLDKLLSHGAGPEVRGDILRLSEEFHIITPYTSLLVLETDADRERFGVKRRFEMRDGERFFADGRARANFALVQDQMKRAGAWRIGLRRRILAELANLGRTQPRLPIDAYPRPEFGFSPINDSGVMVSNSTSLMRFGGGAHWYFGGGLAGGMGGMGGMGGGSFGGGGPMGSGGGEWNVAAQLGDMEEHAYDFGVDTGGAVDGAPAATDLSVEQDEDLLLTLGTSVDDSSVPFAGERQVDFDGTAYLPELRKSVMGRRGEFAGRWSGAESTTPLFEHAERLFDRRLRDGSAQWAARAVEGYFDYEALATTQWLDELYPPLSRAWKPRPDAETPPGWSPEAVQLARSLSRRESLAKLAGGLELRRTGATFDPDWKEEHPRTERLVLASRGGWLARSLEPGADAAVQFCDAGERGVYSRTFQSGRVRKAAPYEPGEFPLELNDYSLDLLVDSADPRSTARIEPAGEGRATLVVTRPAPWSGVDRYLIDTVRRVLVRHENRHDGQFVRTTTYDDFVELAGSWWARKITETDESDRVVSATTLKLELLAADAFAARWKEERAPERDVQFLRLPAPTLRVARRKIADGTATFEDRMVRLTADLANQQWDDVFEQVAAIERESTKPGVRWMRTLLASRARQGDVARLRLLAEARRLADKSRPDDLPLVEWIFSQSAQVASPAERLEILQLLKPTYQRLPAELRGTTTWNSHLAGLYENLGRRAERRELLEALATSRPSESHRQVEYARALADSGDYAAAHAWLAQALERRQMLKGASEERRQLRATAVDLFRRQSRWEDLVRYTAAWIEAEPKAQGHESAYTQHLAALLYADRLVEADSLAERWLREAREQSPLDEVRRARLNAALEFSQGHLPQLWRHRAEPRWTAPILETLRVFQDRANEFDVARQLASHSSLAETDELDRMRGEWLARLQREADRLASEPLGAFVIWTLDGRLELTEPLAGRRQVDAREIPDATWAKIAQAIRTRWEKAAEGDDKQRLGDALVSIYSRRFAETEYLPFLRQRLDVKDAGRRLAAVRQLFDALLAAEWTEARETELFALLRQLSDAKDPYERLNVELPELHRLTDALLEARRESAEQKWTDQGGLDKLTRRELASKRAEFDRQTRSEFSRRLADEAKRSPGPLGDWMGLERAWIDVRRRENLADAEAVSWRILGAAPPPSIEENPIEEPEPAPLLRETWETMARQRAWLTVGHLAARRGAPEATVDRIVRYVDAGIALRDDRSDAWKFAKFQLLVALDRPDELERELREWARTDDRTAPWRASLGKLLAERGRLDEAISIYESCRKDKLLGPSEMRMLSDWYLVRDRRAEHEQARLEALRLTPEDVLSRYVHGVQQRCQAPTPPKELEDELFLTFRVLFEKSNQPGAYAQTTRAIYASTRDFRLLQVVVDSLPGLSPQRGFSMVHAIDSQVLSELRNEAAADEILERVKTARGRELPASDRRALDLLEALVERKSAEVLDQPGPHVAASLVALRRAFGHPRTIEEAVLFGDFLIDLGGITQEPLRDEQLRQLHELSRELPAGRRERFSVTARLGRLLFEQYGRRDEGLRLFATALDGYAATRESTWPAPEDQGLASSYVSLLEAAGRHGEAETLLARWEKATRSDAARLWCLGRRRELYYHAFQAGGTVSLGAGRAATFGPYLEFLRREMDEETDEGLRERLLDHWVETLRLAHKERLPGAHEATTRLAFDVLPPLARRQTAHHVGTIVKPIGLVRDVLGPRSVLRYVVERMEQFKPHVEYLGSDPWAQLGDEMARSREEARDKELDERVLRLATARLESSLRHPNGSRHSLYMKGHPHFWAEKAGEFQRIAVGLTRQNPRSGRIARRVAEYVRGGLLEARAAHEVMFAADAAGTLDEGSVAAFATWLMEDRREALAIPLFERLIASSPDDLGRRTSLIFAYQQAERPESAERLLGETLERFHRDGRWTIDTMTALARTCEAIGRHEQAVELYREAISLHQRTRGARENDAELSQSYQSLAGALAQLGKTAEAVDAASAAIVLWSTRHDERVLTLGTLRDVLQQSPDLKAYLRAYEEQVDRTGQDGPLLRKLIGQALLAAEEKEEAVKQLRIAVELQPNDAESRESLVSAYDALEDREAAGREMLALVELRRGDLGLLKQLALRWADDEARAERADTSIIEAGPNEAENHALLAELRQEQERWGDAIEHWKRVDELRSLEPTGLLKLLAAQLHEQRWDDARATLRTLEKTEWPERFRDALRDLDRLRGMFPKPQDK